MRPPSAAKAAAATSGPMPEGSPMVTRMGALGSALTGFDIGFAPQIAQILPGERGDLFFEQLLFHFVTRGHLERSDLRHGRITAHDDFHACRRNERCRRFTRLR